MRKNSLHYAVLFAAVTYLIHLLNRSPLSSGGFLLTYLPIVFPLLAAGLGILWLNKSYFTWERALKVTIGSFLIGCISIVTEYNRVSVLSDSYLKDPDWLSWVYSSVFEFLRVMLPAFLFVGILKYAFFRIRLFPLRQAAVVLSVFSFCSLLFPYLSHSFLPWIFEELIPLLFPGVLLSLSMVADQQLNARSDGS